MKKIIAVTMVSLMATSVLLADNSAQIMKKLSSELKNTNITSVNISTDLPELYEIHAGKNIFYTDNNASKIMIGHIFNLNGVDLTQAQLDKIMQKDMKEHLDMSKALVVGNPKKTKHEIIMFTDPQCPFCRKGEEMIKDANATKYIFFTPLPMHNLAKPLAIDILCSSNPPLEYTKVMNGELDGAKLMTCDAGAKRLNEMIKIGEQFGVTGTPLFFIDGKRIEGANPIIQNLVK